MTSAIENGLSAVDCTGITLGNGDLDESCSWAPPASTERAPLPGHEHLMGVEYEPLPGALPWLTHGRAIALGWLCVPIAAALRFGGAL